MSILIGSSTSIGLISIISIALEAIYKAYIILSSIYLKASI
jgi:hypothetical protein